MKRKIDHNQLPLRNSIPWRTMLGAVLFCLLTSVSFGQNAQLTSEEIQALQTELNQLENKMANPMVANNAPVAAEFSERIIAIQKRIIDATAYLQSTDPKAAQLLSSWTEHSEIEQIQDQTVTISNNLDLQKAYIQWQIENVRPLDVQTIGSSINP